MADDKGGSFLTSSESNEPVTSDNENSVCDACYEDGTNVSANGYCVDCEEYLCVTCYSHHYKPRPSRHHVLQDATTMPRSRAVGRSSSNMARFNCYLHHMKEISAYCKSHDALCCEGCVQSSHPICKDVRSVQSLAADIFRGEEFKKFIDKLQSVDEKYRTIKTRSEINLKMTDKCYKTTMYAFKRKLDDVKSKDVSKMTAIGDACDTVRKQLHVWISDKDKLQCGQRNDQMFVVMKLTEKQLAMAEKNAEQLSADNFVVEYSFIEEDDNNETTLGKLVKIPILVKKLDVQHSSERKKCILADIALLGNDLMLVSDCNNHAIKLLNTSSNTILSYANLNSRPFQMAVTDNNQVYVAKPDSKELLHLLTPTMDASRTRSLPVDGACYTVKYHNQKLKIQCRDPCTLLETDLNGNVQKILHTDISTEKDEQGEIFARTPLYSIVESTTGSFIYLCYTQNSITKKTDDGKKLQLVVKSDRLQSPRSLVMDTDGSLLVCSVHGKCVFRVTGTGEIQDTILLEFSPWSLALDTKTRNLYVGGSSYNHVLVYHI